jgi:hypothetical protein
MASTFNLIRNSKVFFTTNVDSTTGKFLEGTPCTTSNSYQVTVLDGFSFSQGTNSDTVSIAEAGGNAVRGSRNFNTSLNAAEFSFSTYIRPYLATTVKSDEAVLWNALVNDVALGTAAAYTMTGIGGSTAIDAAGVLTITGTAMATTGVSVGDVVIVKGVTGAGANQYNTAIKILTAPTATGFTAQYLTKPSAAIVPASWTTAVTLNKVSWVENAAVPADTGLVTAYSEVSTARSNLNQLQKFALVITVDQVTYALDNCVLDQASIDFGLDGIATIAWTGKAAGIRQITKINFADPTGGTPGGAGGTIVLTGGNTGSITASSTSTKYITNKLSTIALAANIGGGGTAYTLALTGGSITIANNVNYITPSNLGVVNSAIGYYTGNRQISGSINAYLRTGTNNTADLLASMLSSSASNAETKYAITLSIGGAANPLKVELYGVGAALQIPTIDAQAVMSTTINFNLQGTDAVVGTAGAAYDLENTNDLRIRYFSPT